MADFLAQILLELPAAGIAWALQRFTRLSQQNAEFIATLLVVALIAAACFTAWFMYLST